MRKVEIEWHNEIRKLRTAIEDKIRQYLEEMPDEEFSLINKVYDTEGSITDEFYDLPQAHVYRKHDTVYPRVTRVYLFKGNKYVKGSLDMEFLNNEEDETYKGEYTDYHIELEDLASVLMYIEEHLIKEGVIYRPSKKEEDPDKVICDECNRNAETEGDYLEGSLWPYTYFMVKDELWKQYGNGQGELCIHCFEGKLGRKITEEDLADVPLNELNNIRKYINNQITITP